MRLLMHGDGRSARSGERTHPSRQAGIGGRYSEVAVVAVRYRVMPKRSPETGAAIASATAPGSSDAQLPIQHRQARDSSQAVSLGWTTTP